MADKGFPEIRTDGVITVIPPRKRPGQKQFSKKEMELTKKVASVRIHVERVIQRLKMYKILSHTLNLKLLAHIHKIVTVVAVLVNCQPHIIAPKPANEGEEESLPENFWEDLGCHYPEGQEIWDDDNELTDTDKEVVDKMVEEFVYEAEREDKEEEEEEVKKGRRQKRQREENGSEEEENEVEEIVEVRRRSSRLMNKCTKQ